MFLYQLMQSNNLCGPGSHFLNYFSCISFKILATCKCYQQHQFKKVLLNEIMQTSQLLARFLLVAKSNPPGQAQEVSKQK